VITYPPYFPPGARPPPQLVCVRNCKCEGQLINGQVISQVHNESVFMRHTFGINGTHRACVLRLTVLGPAPGSTGAKVKLRSLVVTTASAPAHKSRARARG